jgi:hypothetical protein
MAVENLFECVDIGVGGVSGRVELMTDDVDESPEARTVGVEAEEEENESADGMFDDRCRCLCDFDLDDFESDAALESNEEDEE